MWEGDDKETCEEGGREEGGCEAASGVEGRWHDCGISFCFGEEIK